MRRSVSCTAKGLVVGFLTLRFCLQAAMCLAFAFSDSRAAPSAANTPQGLNCAFRRPLSHARRKSGVIRVVTEEIEIATSLPFANVGDHDERNEGSVDDRENTENDNATALSSIEINGVDSSSPVPTKAPVTSTSAERWKRRKQIAAGLLASVSTTVVAAKAGWLGAYSDNMIARDTVMTALTSVLAVALNRGITWGYEHGKYDSKTGRKITHILSAPLFIVTWPFFSEASGARIFAGLVCLTNMYRLYLAGTGDAAESSLANTISRSGDKSEVMGGPFIYVCLFQFFLLVFWRSSFPGVVAMTTMAAGDGMADIIGRNYGRNGYKWPFGDGDKSLVGTIAFAVSAFVLTTVICSWLIATGSLVSSLTLSAMATKILAISCICALVEILPLGDDNYTVPGSAALLAALWLQ